MTVLVTGATGHVGRHVVEGLVEAGEQVRALTRDPAKARFPEGVEVVQGDLAEPGSVDFAGVDRLFLFPVPETAKAVVERARGVNRIVVLSSGAVTFNMDTDFHLPVEQAVEASGAEWTHVRPGDFALNRLAMWGPSVREDGTIWDPSPDEAGYPIHERDIADVAVRALVEDGHAGKAYTITGPEVLTSRQMAERISAATGREITFRDVTADEALAYYRELGGEAAVIAGYMIGSEGYDTEGVDWDEWELKPTDDVQRVLGRPARTFAQWAADHRHDWM